MLKRILFVLCITLIITMLSNVCAKAQTITGNGGQFWENGSVKIEYGGVINSSQKKVWIKIWNKQNCNADERILYGSTDRVLNSVPSGSYDTIQLIIPNDYKIKAKTNTNCGSTDFGWVELLLPTALPVTFYGIQVIVTHTKQTLKQN